MRFKCANCGACGKQYPSVRSLSGFASNAPWEPGEIVGYHGREGRFRGYTADGYVLVYFDDVADEESIEFEELYQQDIG